MARNYFKNVRQSSVAQLFFGVIMSNLMLFASPLQAMLTENKYSCKNNVAFYRNHLENIYNPSNDKTELTNIGNSSGDKNSTSAYREQYVFNAQQHTGIIGKSFDAEIDNPYDNFFTIDIPDGIIPVNYDITLSYELYGLSGASQTTKSINNHFAYGGAIIVTNNNWNSVSENIPSGLLKAGYNEIYFNRRKEDNYQYSVRNVRVELKKRNGEALRLSESALVNYGGKVNLTGFVAHDIKSVEVTGISIPVYDGIFDYTLTNIPYDAKDIHISYKNINGKQSNLYVPVCLSDVSVNFDYQDSVTKESSVSFISDAVSSSAEKEGICANFDIGGNAFGRVQIDGLDFKDTRTLNEDIVNVTGGKNTAYRIKRFNIPDNLPVELHIKYNPEMIPSGYSVNDIKTFYFDKDNHTWKAMQTEKLDPLNEEVIVTSYTNETDYINGIIKVPDSPETGSFAPTTISEMKAADPASGVVSIAPPTPNNSGSLTTSFPLKLPQGRNGMQPSLSLNYSSEAGNSWMGIGWNLSTPAITLNTSWGVPTFNPGMESEIYSVNGADLVLKAGTIYTNPHRDSNISRTADRIFYQRKESGGYSKIIRHGSSTKNYWWEVIDNLGTKTFYGGYNGLDNSAVIKTALGDIVYWGITRVVDPYGNSIQYTYQKGQGPISTESSVTAQWFYLSSISYTMHNNASNYYRVDLLRNTYTVYEDGGNTNPINRNDVILSARNGCIQVVKDLLTEAQISFIEGGQATRIRTYRFDYTESVFQKQQLVKISEFDKNNVLFYTNTMDYYREQIIIIPISLMELAHHGPEEMILFHPHYRNCRESLKDWFQMVPL